MVLQSELTMEANLKWGMTYAIDFDPSPGAWSAEGMTRSSANVVDEQRFGTHPHGTRP